jgi:hypothetical protein
LLQGAGDANRSYELVDYIDPLQGGEVPLNILLTSVPQTVFTPVFTFTYTCLTLYKHWQQLFFFTSAILTNSAVSNGHFLELYYRGLTEKPLEYDSTNASGHKINITAILSR